MLIHEVKETSGSTYQLFADLKTMDSPVGHYMLTFYSVWTGAKDPEAPQVKGQYMLGPDAIDNLKELLETQ